MSRREETQGCWGFSWFIKLLSGRARGADEAGQVPPAACVTNSSIDGQSGRCPICLHELVKQKVGSPEACNHSFCVDCLQLKNSNTCPIDQQVCDVILVLRCLERRVIRRIKVVPPVQQQKEEEEEVTRNSPRCEACGYSIRFRPLIYCDRCGRAYHLACVVSLGEWFCIDCCWLSSPHVQSEDEEPTLNSWNQPSLISHFISQCMSQYIFERLMHLMSNFSYHIWMWYLSFKINGLLIRVKENVTCRRVRVTKWRVLVRMIEFINSLVTHTLLITR
jgi:hypothetical protein